MYAVNWKQKLSSRKFWAAVVGFATALGVLLGIDYPTMEQIAVLITAASVLIAYILGEGAVDAAKERGRYREYRRD